MRKENLEEFGRRVRARMGEMSIKDLAARIGMSYEMTRRYSKGWAMPDNPKVLEALATALGTSVGYLLAGELESNKLPPLVAASDLVEPVREPTRMSIEDDAMTVLVENIRLFGIADQVILYPRRPLPGDIVALHVNSQTTLRKMVETSDGPEYLPTKSGYATHRAGTVVGVVAEVHGRVERFR